MFNSNDRKFLIKMYFNIYNQSINNLHILGYARYELDLHLALEYPIYTGVYAFVIPLYVPIASVIFNDALSSRNSSIVPLSKQRHERKEHSRCRMALNGRLIYRAYRT